MTIRILSHYRVTDPDVACAALLHDAVEDHADGLAPGGTGQAALAVLADRFGGRTAALVGAVTNPAWEPGRDKHEQYRTRPGQPAASPWARVNPGVGLHRQRRGHHPPDRPEAGQAGLASTHRWYPRCASSSCARTPRWRPTSRN